MSAVRDPVTDGVSPAHGREGVEVARGLMPTGPPSQHQLKELPELPAVAHTQPTSLYPYFWGLGGQCSHVSTPLPPVSCQGKEARATMGGFRHRGELFVSKVGRRFLEALIHAPTHTAGSLLPHPRAVLYVPRQEDGKHPPPRACHHSSQPFLPGPPTSGNSWDTLPSGGSLAPKPRAGNILSLS